MDRSLDFSEAHRGTQVLFSPDGACVAAAVDNRLIVRDSETLQVLQLYSCLDKIQRLEWARNSLYILCCCYKKGVVQAYSVRDAAWSCKIDEGVAGLAHARWSPDCLQILCTAEFNIRTTVWSLTDRSCFQLKGPKHPVKCVAFSPSTLFMALGDRQDCKDRITIFATSGWKVAASFACGTADLEEMAYSPDGACIAAADSLLEYAVLLYSPDGELKARYSAYGNALGVKSLAWSPCGQLLGVGSFDQALRLLNAQTWSQFAEFRHAAAVRAPLSAIVYREEEEEGGARAHYAIAPLPAPVPTVKPQPDKPTMRVGVGQLAWSANTQFVATRNDSQPAAVWVWDVTQLSLAAVLLHTEPVRSLAWDPHATRLAICTGGARVYLWSPEGSSCVHVPLPGFKASALAWNPTGAGFLLTDGDASSFCCAFLAGGYDDEMRRDEI